MSAESDREDREHTWAGAYGTLVGATVVLGYLNGGAAVAGKAMFWLLGLTLVAFAVICVVGLAVNFTRVASENGGDPVVAWGVLVICSALLALLVTGAWLLALGVGLGLALGYWQWKRPTQDVA
jgi:hypothetical protein